MAMINYSVCDDFMLCRLISKYNPDVRRENSLQPRTAYYGFGSPSHGHGYYPAFDPISVLASLAFLAFLLQSFASLFDRSRSILPSIMSARETPHNIDDLQNEVDTALRNYASFEDSLKKEKHKLIAEREK